MQNEAFKYTKFSSGSYGGHAHCEFCWHKFMENPENIPDCSDIGYLSLNGRHWVCERCFADFRDALRWTLVK